MKVNTWGGSLGTAGAALLFPAILLVVGGLSHSLGMPRVSEWLFSQPLLIHPVVVMGGLISSCLMNLLAVFRIDYRNGALTGSVQVKGRLFNIVLLGFGGCLALMIFVYLMAENIQS